jgi:pimeloyl-ACP methyl ester carboxylesterase
MRADPKTIVLLHGFWVTPRSWEHWITRYESRGYRVLAPAYPGFEVEVEALNKDSAVIAAATIPGILEKFESIVQELDAPPILMGHSAGGVFVQLLLDRGYGACGVAINSAPTEGVQVVPWSQIKTVFPLLKNPANRHRAVALDYEHWKYGFTNTFSEEASRAAYERYAIPSRAASSGRAPELSPTQGRWTIRMITGNPALHRRRGTTDAVGSAPTPPIHAGFTEVHEYPPLPLPAAAWVGVADYALEWAVEHARA